MPALAICASSSSVTAPMKPSDVFDCKRPVSFAAAMMVFCVG